MGGGKCAGLGVWAHIFSDPGSRSRKEAFEPLSHWRKNLGRKAQMMVPHPRRMGFAVPPHRSQLMQGFYLPALPYCSPKGSSKGIDCLLLTFALPG